MYVVGAAIINGGEMLLMRTQKHRRTWIFPGGKLETHENTEGCLRREIREELPGLRFTIGRFLGVYSGSLNRVRKIQLIVYRVSSGTRFTLGDEILEARWVGVGDLGKLHLANTTAEAIAVLQKKGEL